MYTKLIAAAIFAVGIMVSIAATHAGIESGLKVGESVSAFHPHHVAGPHKGTDACPPCTYGALPAVQVWVNGDDAKNVEAISQLLNKRVGSDWSKSKFKAFFIFVTDPAKKAETASMIEALASKTNSKIAMAWIDKNDEAVEAYKVNTDASVKNTVIVYKDMQVKSKFVNLNAADGGLKSLTQAIDGIYPAK